MSTTPSKQKQKDVLNVEEGSSEVNPKDDYGINRSITPPVLDASLDLNSNTSNYEAGKERTPKRK